MVNGCMRAKFEVRTFSILGIISI